MIFELVVKCATLIAVIHAFRFIGRRAGPRASGLILGLPSSTAILLVLCGLENGTATAVEMADSGLLGLIAAVALPLAYARAVREGWSFPCALGVAVAGYVLVASCLGFVHPSVSAQRLALSFGSILAASLAASRIGPPAEVARRSAPAGRWIPVLRTIIPVLYVVTVGIVTGVASPRWAGLVSTFPSMSTAVLAVTHLEEGAAPASRIARALPPANLSTAAFLATFRLGCPSLGIVGGVLCGYLAAMINLAAIEAIPRSSRLRRPLVQLAAIPRTPIEGGLASWRRLRSLPRLLIRPGARHAARIRPPHRRHFAPCLEILPC
jgi:hypothetical protein